MSSKTKIYKIKDFIRKNEKGKLDFDRSIEIVRELVVAASFHTDHNILVDLRETTVDIDMTELLILSIEFAHHKSLFKNKLASIIPNDGERISIANKFKDNLDAKGFQFKYFTSFEDAIEWLSDITSPY